MKTLGRAMADDALLHTPPPAAASASMAPPPDDRKLRRREQNRLSAQRSYHKKQERLQVLRGQVSQLEAQYQRRVTTMPDGGAGSDDTANSTAILATTHVMAQLRDDDAMASLELENADSATRQAALQRLVGHHARLQSENDALRRQVDDHSHFHFRLQSLVAAGDGMDGGVESGCGGTSALAELAPPPSVPSGRATRITMKRPLTIDECHEIGRNAYQQISAYKFPEHHLTTGGSACGWSDKRVQEDGRLKFELRKTFLNKSAHDVAMASWTAVGDPQKLQTLYSVYMNLYCEVAQRIDDNNLVMYQEYEMPERDTVTGEETGAILVMHHVMLMTMFQIERGYMMVFCSLEPDRLDDSDHIVDTDDDLLIHQGETQASSCGNLSSATQSSSTASSAPRRRLRKKGWFRKFSWLKWESVGAANESTECSYTFTVPMLGRDSQSWPLEILLLIMRYENATVGPAILLRNGADDEDADDDHALEDSRIKIEPLELDPIVAPRLSSTSTCSAGIGMGVDDDVDELFIELFP